MGNLYDAQRSGFQMMLQGVTDIDPSQYNFPIYATEIGFVGHTFFGTTFLTGEAKGQGFDWGSFETVITRMANDAAILECRAHNTVNGVSPVERYGVRFVDRISDEVAKRTGLKRGDRLPDDWPASINIE